MLNRTDKIIKTIPVCHIFKRYATLLNSLIERKVELHQLT